LDIEAANKSSAADDSRKTRLLRHRLPAYIRPHSRVSADVTAFQPCRPDLAVFGVCVMPNAHQRAFGRSVQNVFQAIERSLDGEDVLTLLGSNDKLRGGANGSCDEAVGFDAFHGFAGRLEFGSALEGDAGSDRDFGDAVLPLDVLEQAFAAEPSYWRTLA
jgi:hypothetical protein